MSSSADIQSLQHQADVQSYIRCHNLAVLMDTLMQQLLEERPRPKDPMLWIADRLKLERTLRRRSRSLAPTLGATANAAGATGGK